MNSVGRADESLEAAREAVGLYEELAATAAAAHAKHLGDALGFMAALLCDAGRRDEAEALFAEVLTRFAETPDGFGPIFLVRGDWHISRGDMRAAIDDLDAAMRAAENAGDRSTRGRVRGTFVTVANRTARPSTAHGRTGNRYRCRCGSGTSLTTTA
jgi:tetratricopeptide (TPR) repeat protein